VWCDWRRERNRDQTFSIFSVLYQLLTNMPSSFTPRFMPRSSNWGRRFNLSRNQIYLVVISVCCAIAARAGSTFLSRQVSTMEARGANNRVRLRSSGREWVRRCDGAVALSPQPTHRLVQSDVHRAHIFPIALEGRHGPGTRRQRAGELSARPAPRGRPGTRPC
jgi:hypothetical protein